MTNAYEIANAKIIGTFIGKEGHGIPTCSISCEWRGGVQGFGGYDLRHYGLTFINEIMRCAGVETWDELKGKHIRIYRSNRAIRGIGHIIDDSIKYFPEGE